ncbi:hypothetical protein TWF788_002862 [Orbilia oligospora]|uniref:MIF4G domain-containing protein n=1 Tax=Orbilia oligospora TaxID=2813651 RepID=A0A6G1LRJ9_ORBOL|nr:hypothetical protein TWF788_002862 [Orbilia oligospora]KAF3196734.1 hypothetical protein TWF679_004493 [Orbilia oligospora]KAF3201727.1 hypothetical protein TWF191_003251 [Orbilia oligospora]KAF3232762.1 hypothetical protein TWF192_002857 [Orbilia oligospora]
MTSITSTGPTTAPSSAAPVNVNLAPLPIPPSSFSTPILPNKPPSTQSGSASSPLPARSLSYAQASKKSSTIVSSSTLPAQQPSAAVTATQAPTLASNARHSLSTPSPVNVNGKPSIIPAVPPLVANPPPASSSSGNLIVNGSSSASSAPSSSSTSHGRKPSLATQSSQQAPWGQQQQQTQQPQSQPQNGLRMPPGQQPPTPSSIHFGNVSNGPHHASHVGSSPALPPSVPLAPSASSDLPAGSPQTSPSPVPQPAASGGPPPSLPRQGMPAFGSVTENSDPNRTIPQRPVSMPPNAPLNPNIPGPPPHPRRDSGHGDGPIPAGISHGRGMPQGNHRGRNQHQMGGNFSNQYPPHNNPAPFASPGYSNTPQYRAGPNQQRGGATGPVGSPYQTPAHMANFNNNRGGRSPALTHSLPSTPQMSGAQLAGNAPMQHSPHMNYQHLSPHPHMQPMQPMYSQEYGQSSYYNQHQPHYMPYPQPPFIPPGSPRTGYMPPQPQQGGYMPPPFQTGQSSSMARTASQPSDHHLSRPSGMPHMPHGSPLTSTNIPPPLSHPGPTPPVPSNPNNQFFKKVEKTSKKIEIRDPNTGTVKTFSNLPPPPPISGRSPVIVSSSPAPDNVAHARAEAKPVPVVLKPSGAKTIQEVRDEIKATVYREIQVKKQQEEDELRQKKEEEERKAREEEEEVERLQREEMEKERIEKERIEKEQREKEQREKEQREKEQREKEQREKEEVERKAAEEKEAAEAAAKAKAEVEAEEERLRLEREKEAMEEARRKERAEEAEKQRLVAEAEELKKQEAATLETRRVEELRKSGSPATRASTPAGPGDEDADAKAVATAIKGSTPLPATSKEVGDLASDIAKITVNSQATTAETQQNPPAPKSNQRKPAPLNLQLKTSSEPALPSAALTALRSARFIDDINKVAYPPSIISPNPALNANAPNGKFKYEKDFLMQFQTVFTDKPSTDWEQRMRDTVGEPDSARPMGGSRAPSSAGPGKARSALPGPPPSMGMGMGTFRVGGGVGGSVMPPSGRQSSNSPFPIGVPRPFPARNHSSTQLSSQGSAPQSPGGPKGSQRSGSKNIPRRGGMDGKRPSQGGTSKAELEPINPPPATAPADFEPLKATASAWKPRTAGGATASSSLSNQISAGGNASSDEPRLSPEMVQRKVKAALNKMTPEKFDKIADQILEIASQSRYETDGRSLRQVIQLTFEKATDEPNFSSMYAKFCKRMLESMHPDIKDENIKDKNGNIVTGGALFRKYLLNRCQEEFERGWKVNLPPKPEGVSEEAALMSDEYYVAAAAKRRGLGLIQFIGELFKLQMLTERIMHECVKKLVDYEGTPEEEEVESLCKLLRTIGYALDATEKSRLAMDAYFNRIQQMMDSKELNSRMKFMLLDVVELRKVNWESKEADKGPKTIAEIREEAQKAQLEKEAAAARDKQRQRSQAGRGDGRSFSQGGYGGNQGFQDQRQNQTLGTDELRRLGGIKPLRQTPGGSFGPSAGLFGRSGSSSGSRKGLGGLGAPSNLQPGADSGVSSRTATPPVTRDSVASTNSFSLLSSHQDGTDNSESHETSGPNDTGSTNESKSQSADS